MGKRRAISTHAEYGNPTRTISAHGANEPASPSHQHCYRRLLEMSAAGRADTPDDVGNAGVLLSGPDGAFITGSGFLMDGGVTTAYWFGDLGPK